MVSREAIEIQMPIDFMLFSLRFDSPARTLLGCT